MLLPDSFLLGVHNVFCSHWVANDALEGDSGTAG